jgi:hypothetical protein
VLVGIPYDEKCGKIHYSLSSVTKTIRTLKTDKLKMSEKCLGNI